MANEIISFFEMCAKEGGASLQGGMYFRLRGGNHSVALMSVRSDAPYADRIEDEGETLIYEGHNAKRNEAEFPKLVDQPMHLKSGNPTQNGKFYTAAQKVARGEAPAERVRVYEKLKKGMWIYNGVFHLVDAWIENDGRRDVFKFKLVAVEGDENFDAPVRADTPHARVIPTAIKIEVWNRDGGKCITCGASDELHYDHILPYSRGGTSLRSDNIQLLCARHNLQKSDKIM